MTSKNEVAKKTYTNYEKYHKKQLKNARYKKAYEEELKQLRYAYKISQLRKSEKLTQKEFADKIKTTQSVVSRIEQGNQNVTINYLEKIADVFNKELVINFKEK